MISEMCARLGEQIRVVLAYAEIFQQTTDREPAPDCVAAAERLLNADLAHPGWGDAPATGAQVDVALKLAASRDHLLAFAVLLEQERPTPLAHMALVRASMEAAGRGAWLLDAANARERIGRWVGERQSSMRVAAHALRETTGVVDKETLSRRDALLEAAKVRQVKQKTPPTYEELVRRLLADEPLARDVGLVYNLLSAVTHAEPWGLRQLLELLAEPIHQSSEVKVVGLLQSDATVAWLGIYAILSHRAAFRRLVKLYGPLEGLSEWEQQILLVFDLVRPALPNSPA